MASPSGTVVLFAYTFFSIEFVINIFVLAIACLNLAIIGTTKLLHPNLKCILITQSVAVVFITFIIAFVNMLTYYYSWRITQFNLLTSIFSTTLSFVEFLAIIIIGRYNRLKYNSQIEEASANNYHIGQRYQVLENVKTAKQLFPTFLCIFLSNLAFVILCIIITTNVAKEEYQIVLIYAFFFLIGTILAGAIEISVITHHPLLKRRVARLLKRFFYLRRSIQIDETPHSVELAINRRDGMNEATEHFKTLQKLWNK
uniref:G_PROTEIN_RECEP_F1_2 domain-containing protein n=1 Tax=Globodera pallida TaxID=36090 RepID=A0A183BZD4_GLOPA